MNRNATHHPILQSLDGHPSLELDSNHTIGPVSFFNATRAHFLPTSESPRPLFSHSEPPDAKDSRHLPQQHPSVAYKWTSRNNRKGRHALVVSPESKHFVPPITSSLKETSHGIFRMFTSFPVWDVSYDVATIFTLGSVVWVINAFFVWLPLVRPDTEFKDEILYGGGITAFIGATIFEVGSVLLMLEAVNENNTGCFGWAFEQAFAQAESGSDGSDGTRLRPSGSHCTHHHANKQNLVGRGSNDSKDTSALSSTVNPRSWIWRPSLADLRAHYIHEIGFLASFIQLCAATIFWVSGFTALPGIYDHMSRSITIIFYWTPQVLGGIGFVLSGALFMIETQSRWYKPAFGTLGWWIGFWNTIGGLGFLLCPAFGYDTDSWAQFQASTSTFWGSWAFLIGSVIQWYESLGKHPVEVDKSLRTSGKN